MGPELLQHLAPEQHLPGALLSLGGAGTRGPGTSRRGTRTIAGEVRPFLQQSSKQRRPDVSGREDLGGSSFAEPGPLVVPSTEMRRVRGHLKCRVWNSFSAECPKTQFLPLFAGALSPIPERVHQLHVLINEHDTLYLVGSCFGDCVAP